MTKIYQRKLTTMCYYKSLQITAVFGVITNYDNTLLKITAGITNYEVITNYVVTS